MKQFGVAQNTGHVYFLVAHPEAVDADDDTPTLTAQNRSNESSAGASPLFAEVLALAEPSETGTSDGDLIASIGRGSDLEACGHLGESLARAAQASTDSTTDGAGEIDGVSVEIWRLLDINTILWSHSANASIAPIATATEATVESEPVQQES